MYLKGALHQAIRAGNEQKVRKICTEAPQDLNNIVEGITALHVAADLNLENIAHILLKGGASTEVTDGSGETPAFYAAKRDNAEVLEVLGGTGRADFELIVKGTTPLHIAAAGGYHRCIKSMFTNEPNASRTSSANSVTSGVDEEAPIDIDCKDEHGETPLHRAAEEGHTKAVMALLELGARWSGGYEDAKEGESLPVEEEEGTEGVQPSPLRRGGGPTPAHYAAASGHELTIRALAKFGASFHQVDAHGRDVYDIAIKHDHGWLFKIMKEIDDGRGRGPGGVQSGSPQGADGGDSVAGGSKSSYLSPGGKLRGNKGVQLPESWGDHKWPWQRKKGI